MWYFVGTWKVSWIVYINVSSSFNKRGASWGIDIHGDVDVGEVCEASIMVEDVDEIIVNTVKVIFECQENYVDIHSLDDQYIPPF